MRALLLPVLLLPIGLRAQDSLLVFWSGALTPTAIEVRCLANASVDSLRLEVDTDPAFPAPERSATTARDTTGAFTALKLKGLQPGTPYHYRFLLDGVPDTTALHQGGFTTPVDGPFSYTFVAGSCNSWSDHPVWWAMRFRDPLFFLSVGDLHYANPNSLDASVHRQAYGDEVLTHVPAADLLHHVPLAYVWDDHDFCGNGSDATFIGRSSAALAYRQAVPHYPLHHPVSVHQSFTIGRVHFILSDLRSAKDSTHMMDGFQRSWLQGELVYARDHGLVACWVSPLTWNSIGYPENWGCQPVEREALGNFLRDTPIPDLFILSGDAHMLAIDSGTNTDFSTGADNPHGYPVFQVAAIAQGGSYKGGTFDQGGYFPNPDIYHGQFGEVHVEDDGTQVCITFRGWRTDSLSFVTTLVDSFTFCRTPADLSGIAEARTDDPAPCTWWTLPELAVYLPGASGEGQAELVDAAGRLLRTLSINWNEGVAVLRIGEAPASGCYFLRLSANGLAGTQRLCAP